MVRTQIQIPDRLYETVRRIARAEETSVTQLVREALVHWTAMRADPETAETAWEVPPAADLGIRRTVPVSRWRALAHEPPAAAPRTRSGR